MKGAVHVPYCPLCRELLKEWHEGAPCPQCGRTLQVTYSDVEATQSICPQCRSLYADDAVYCKADGKALLPVEQVIPTCARCGTEYGLLTTTCPLDGAEVILHWPDSEEDLRQVVAEPDTPWQRTIGVSDVVRNTFLMFRQQQRFYLRYGFRVLMVTLLLALVSVALTVLLGEFGLALGTVAVLYYSARFSVALLSFALKQHAGRTMRYQDFFPKDRPAVIRSILTYLLLMSILTSTGLRSSLLWVLNVALLTITYFVVPLLVDRSVSLWAALRSSFRHSLPLWPEILMLTGITAMVNMLGLLFFGLGIVVTLPLTFCLHVQAYRRVWPQQ